jgi:hypothetical protein
MEQVLHFQIPTLDLYISQKNYALIKLHGSINWGREIEGTSVHPGNYDHQRLIREAASLRISDRYTVVSEHPMLKRGDTLLFPALSIPVENKDEFSCPQAHVKALEVALPKVTKVLIVGLESDRTGLPGPVAIQTARKARFDDRLGRRERGGRNLQQPDAARPNPVSPHPPW